MPTIDDYAASSATTGRLSAGGSVSGTVESAYDSDWFAITLSPSGSYTFTLNGSTLSDPVLELYDSSGNYLQSNDDFNGLNSQIDYVPFAAGTYYLAARGFSTGTGTYTLSATGVSTPAAILDDYADTAATSGVALIGGAVSGTIEESFDNDWFSATLSANTSYTIALDGSSLNDPVLAVYDGNGVLLTEDDDSGPEGNSLVTFTPTTSGRYFLGARGFGSATGSYSLTVTPGSVVTPVVDDYAGNSGTTGTLASGGQATGNVESVGDQDWFRISLNAGTRYQFGLSSGSGSSGLSEPYLRLFDSNGSLVGEAGGAIGGDAQLSYAASTAGTFYVAAGGDGSSTGTYTLSAAGQALPTRDDYTANTRTRGRITVGDEASGYLERARDVDWFQVRLRAYSARNPIEYIIGVESEEVGLENFTVTIRNNRGRLLTTIPSGGEGEFVYRARSSGQYFISVQAANATETGSYIAYVEEADPEDDESSARVAAPTNRSRQMASVLDNATLSGSTASGLHAQSKVAELSVLAG